MSQAYGITTKVRGEMEAFDEFWDTAIADGVICEREQRQVTAFISDTLPMVEEQDDAMRLSLSILKVGFTPKVMRRIDEHETLHGPVEPIPWVDTTTAP